VNTNLLGQRVTWRYSDAPDCYGTGRIRAVFVGPEHNKVARVLVEVYEGRDGVDPGDVLDLGVHLVRVALEGA